MKYSYNWPVAFEEMRESVKIWDSCVKGQRMTLTFCTHMYSLRQLYILFLGHNLQNFP